MEYLVLARKYRPRQFSEIIGQPHVVRTLENAIRLGRVHHAFLFTGARGVGKTTMARVLARALSCSQGPTVTPCGTCASCVEINVGSGVDVLEIDGASHTGVDHVRELRENARYLPSHGRYKLYIIDEVHMLSQAAFNALLKIIEEPPAHVKFILATTEPHKIPVTILSRCQRFDFRRVSPQVLSDHLRHILTQEGVTLGAAAIGAVVRQAEGSVRDALSLLDQVLSYVDPVHGTNDGAVFEALGVIDRQIVFDLIDAVLRKNDNAPTAAKAVLAAIDQVDNLGHDLSELSALVVEHVRDVLVAKSMQEPAVALPGRTPEEISRLQEQAAQINSADLHRMFTIAAQVAEDVSRSPHARVSLEMGLLRLLEVEPTPSLAHLLARLDRLVDAVPQAPTQVQSQAVSAYSPSSPSSSPKISLPTQPVPSPSAISDAGPTSSRMDEATWRRVIDRVRALQPAIASIWEHGRVMQWHGQAVAIGYAAGSFYLEAARDPDNRVSLQTALDEIFRQPIAITVQSVAPDQLAPDTRGTGGHGGLRSLAELNMRAKEQHEESIRNEAVSHPAVRDALAVLGGEVAHVKPLVQQ